MSGIEVAGLALAVLPILLSAARRYDSVLSPFLRFKRYAREAKIYSKELDIQRTKFRNECRNLLEEITGQDVASGMLDKLADSPAWVDQNLEASLAQRLGKSKQACASLIELIEARLEAVETENSAFNAVVDGERKVKTCKLSDPQIGIF